MNIISFINFLLVSLLILALLLALLGPSEQLFLLDFYILNQPFFIRLALSNYARIGLTIRLFIEPARRLILLALFCVQDVLGQMSVVCYPPYLGAMRILLYQLLSVLNSSLLASIDCTCGSPSYALP